MEEDDDDDILALFHQVSAEATVPVEQAAQVVRPTTLDNRLNRVPRRQQRRVMQDEGWFCV